jgi:hypothetical protein
VLAGITYAFPADGGSKVLTAHFLGLVEVSLLTSCQLAAHGAGGNYLCFSCR